MKPGFFERLLGRGRHQATREPVAPSQAQTAVLFTEVRRAVFAEVQDVIRSVQDTVKKVVKDNLELREQGDEQRKELRDLTKQLAALKQMVDGLARSQEASNLAISDLSTHMQTSTGKKPTPALSALMAQASLAAAVDAAEPLARERRQSGTSVPR